MPSGRKCRCGCAGALTLFWKDPPYPQDFLSSEALPSPLQDSSLGRGQVGMSRLLCVPGGCPALLVRPPGVLLFRHWHRSSGEQNPQGFKVSVGHGLIQMTKGPRSCWPQSCLQGPSLQPVCPTTQRQRLTPAQSLRGCRNPLIKVVISRAFLKIDV